MGGRRIESLEAKAEKTGDIWTVDTELPMGRWKVTLPDDKVTPRLVDVDGRMHARFELPDGPRLELRGYREEHSHPVRLVIQAVQPDGQVEGAEYVYELVPQYPAKGVMHFVRIVADIMGGRVRVPAS